MQLWGHWRWQWLHEEGNFLPSKARPDWDPGVTEGTGLHKQDMLLVLVASLVT